MAHSVQLWLETTSAISDVCHQGCAHIVLQTVKTPVVYSVAYGYVHYKIHLK